MGSSALKYIEILEVSDLMVAELQRDLQFAATIYRMNACLLFCFYYLQPALFFPSILVLYCKRISSIFLYMFCHTENIKGSATIWKPYPSE